jgi:hypothetical protein
MGNPPVNIKSLRALNINTKTPTNTTRPIPNSIFVLSEYAATKAI